MWCFTVCRWMAPVTVASSIDSLQLVHPYLRTQLMPDVCECLYPSCVYVISVNLETCILLVLHVFVCPHWICVRVQAQSVTPGRESGAARWLCPSSSDPSSTARARCRLTERTRAELGLGLHTCPCKGELHRGVLPAELWVMIWQVGEP